MTIDELDQIYSALDQGIEASLSAGDANPPCKRGCFHCCREPAYASSEEIKGVLSLLSEDRVNDLRIKVSLWRDLFLKSGLDTQDDTPVIPYRTLNLWCPLLNVDGSCSVYSRRPCCCRVHIAMSNPEKFENDELRLHQKFIYLEDIGGRIVAHLMGTMEDGDRMIFDHIGLVLYEAIFGVATMTNSRVEVEIKGTDAIIKTRKS